MTKITDKEKIQKRLEEEVKVKPMEDISNHYDDAMEENQYLKNHPYTDEEI